MYTYNLKVKERTVQIKMLKAQAEAVAREVTKIFDVSHSWRELWGTLGGEEHSSVLMCIGGKGEGQITNPEKYAADCAAFVAGLPDLITAENAPAVLALARAIWAEHLPVIDKRETPAQEQAKREEWQTREAEDNAKRGAARLAWAAQYCDSAELIPVPEGMIPVLIEANYDDSDIMTDYFHDHCGHGWEMLLGFVPKNARRTEALHRDFVRRYPQLAALSWKWGVQDYSMGHGYWLQSPAVGTIEGKTTYGGQKDPPFWWEISLGYGRDKGFMPFRGYAEANRPHGTSAGPGPTTSAGEGFTIEQDRDWTWVTFPGKPAEDILARLRSAGGRWSMRRHAWYFTRPVTAEELGLAAVPA